MDSNAVNLVIKKLFLEANRGMLSEVSQRTKRSPQFVRMVFWGQRRSKNVERALQKAMMRCLRGEREGV